MSLTPEQYLALSSLAYENLQSQPLGDFKKSRIDKVTKNINTSKLELRALSSLSDWILVNAHTSSSGMSAIAIQNPKTKEIVFAYRGTEAIERYPAAAIKDWLMDLKIAAGSNLTINDGHNQFVDAASFYIETVRKVGGASNIGERSFTGHSLGGGIAQYMTYFTGGKYNAVTFNAPGIAQALPGVNPRDYDNTVTDYVNENDFIGLYGTRLGREIYIKDRGSQSSRDRNKQTDLTQNIMLKSLSDSVKNNDVPGGLMWVFGVVGAEADRAMNNAVDKGTLDSHKQSALLDDGGKLNPETSQPNPQVEASTNFAQMLFKVVEITQRIVKTGAGVVQFVFDVTYALGYATAQVSVAIMEGGAEIVTTVGESIVKGVYTIGTLIGYGLYDIGSSFGKGISSLIASLNQQAGSAPIRIDPIVLDISGQGITTRSVVNGVYYDLDNNGFAEKTGWIDAKSGILVLDKSSNGKIETGNELFGDRTILDNGMTASSGFAALAALDSNRDGVIDAKDVKFSELRIWVDKDGNGVSTPDELLTLEEAGIKSLNLSNTFIGKVDENGNTIARVGSFTRIDGTTADMKEFFLQRDTADVQMTNSVEIPEDITSLPEIHPMGNIYSLRQAMARDATGTLKQLVQDFISTSDVSARQAKLQDILFTWVGASQINPTSRGSSFDARKLAVLETVTGTSYRNSPTSSPTATEAPILERSYTVLLESVYTMLSIQTGLADVFRKFNYSLDLESKNPIKLDVASVQAYLDEQLQSDAATGEKMLAEVTRVLRNRGIISDEEFTHLREYFAKKSIKYQKIIDTAPLTTILGSDVSDSINGVVDRDNVITAGDGNDALTGSSRNDFLYGDNGDDYLQGLSGNDTLVGGEGRDNLYGQDGNDILIGGTGTDQLRGGAGDDIYRFSRGDGTDYIEETDGFDTIQLGEGILPDDVILQTVSGYGNKISLAITIKNTTDKIVVDGHFGTRIYNSDRLHADNPGSQIERITFSNGASWDIDEIYRRAHDMVGTENADYLASFEDGAYTYHGLGGNDSIVGGSANDFLYGDDGNDNIYGHGGNDVLSGGVGDDQLRGGTGDDVYLFSRGDGVDYIEEADGFDTIQFGEGISPNDVVARVVSTEEKSISLELSIVGTKDKIAVNYHFGRYSYYQQEDIASPGNQIERVMFADGTAWDLDEIYRRAHDMVGTDGNDNFSMVGNAPVIYHGLAGNDNISGRSGKDILYGDAGDDYISGGGTLIGGPGNDNIRGSKGDDIYIFNRGDGQDLITDTGGMDTIRFGDGIRPDDIVIKRVGNGYGHNLELCIKDTNDKVAVYEHFGTNSPWGSVDNPAVKIERVEFADGTVWTKEDIDDKMHNRTGTDGADRIEAYGKRGVVYHGLGGDDNLRGAMGDDQLYGEDGDDRISGGEGNDLIVGGRGNDIIDSFRGDDTYVFNRGDGKDVITDYNGFDTVHFGEGIKPEDIVLKRVYVNRDWSLVMSIRGTEDAVTFISHFDPVKPYLNANYTLEQITFADGTVWTKDDIDYKMHHLTGTEENDQLAAYDKADVVYYGRGGDDNLRGGAGNDQLYGEDGDDQLYGDEGNDLIVGGKGNDTISSFRGDDVYVFNRGDGKDIITDYNGFDMIQLGERIKPEDVVLKRVYINRDWSLEISLKDTDDAITFISHFDPTKPSMSSNHTLERIKFADGTVWTKEDIDDKMHHLTGTEDDDRLAAYDKARVVYHGRGGNDTLVGSEGNDELYGEDGDDRISSGGGSDLIAGGRGNDIIDSFRGDDIYVFNRGDGQDTINDYDGTDTIRFGEGIRPEDIIISRVPWYSNYNLVLSLKDTDDKITVVSHFGSSNYSGYYETPQRRIERFEFADGTVWTTETVDDKMHNLVGTDAKDNLTAYDDKSVTYYGMGGDDTLRGRQGNDVLVGGTDDDYLIGDAGDDTYVFSRGDGKDRVFDTGGNDTIRLGHNHTEVMFKKIYSADLLLEMRGSSDSVQIQEWYNYNSDRRIETIQAEDGYTIQPEKVQQLIQAMASFGNSHGMTWQQALEAHSAEAQSIISQYWTAPTA